MGAYLVLNCEQSPEEVGRLFSAEKATIVLKPFHDATYIQPSYELRMIDCLAGLARANALDWYNALSFDIKSYDFYDHPSNGDMHQICPKFIAFKGPLAQNSKLRLEDEVAFPPPFYAEAFLRMGVSCVVRLNEPHSYDKAEFERLGIRLAPT
jgi:cell division cycle 14